MRFDGNTPIYTAFAIIAIESVWPNPEGGELSPDALDLELLSMETDGGSNVGKPRPHLTGGVSSEEEYLQTQGYYKILPLNIISCKTNSTTQGSSFEVKFTLDDLLLVTYSDNIHALTNATGLPINRADLASMGTLPDAFSSLPEGFQVISDSELGLNRYRISGKNSGFNIEDLVTPNDTVTIWLYHDPQHFYFKDTHTGGDFEEEPGMRWVIGTGDRRSQYMVENPTLTEHVLGVVGLVRNYTREAMNSILEEEGPFSIKMSPEQVYPALRAFAQEGISGRDHVDEQKSLEEYSGMALTGGEAIYRDLLRPLTSRVVMETVREGDGTDEEPARQLTDVAIRAKKYGYMENFIANLTPLSSSSSFGMFDPDNISEEARTYGQKLIDLHPDSDINKKEFSVEGMVISLNAFVQNLEHMVADYAQSGARRSEVTKVTQNFSNGRTVILSGDDTPAHGETPYLALRGQISRVSVNVGSSGGTHTVSISGTGLEKVINEHEVFYDEFELGQPNAANTEFNALYAYMIPPRAALSVINRWAPKQIIMREGASSYSSDVKSTMYYMFDLETPDDPDEVPEGETESPPEESRMQIPEGAVYPVRGNVIGTRHLKGDGEPGISHIEKRVFAPISHADTYRLREGIRILEKIYDESDMQGRIRTSEPLSSNMSIMDNIRRIIGVGELYEIFVDETGRVRYRFVFEAIERTPQPKYTPIIQDVDMIGDGANFSMDDSRVTTMVTVVPIRGSQSEMALSTGYVGRSVPDVARPPLLEFPEGVEEDELSVDLFRYGLKTQLISDGYSAQPAEAKRKAILYHKFYGQPIKSASLKVIGNTSYRAGETVLVSLQKNKYRSRVPINLDKMLEWLRHISTDERLINMYIGVDERLLHPEYYAGTANYQPIPSDHFYQQFSSDPKKFVLDQFIATFEFMKATLPGVNIITPDYFPSTYWYARYAGKAFQGWDENHIEYEDTVELHRLLLRAAIIGDSLSQDDMRERLKRNPGLINSIKFQDFRATSYYISGVTHNFVQDADMSTELSLTYGQDNLVLLEPQSFLPIGFISLEKKMKIGYDSPEQDMLFEEAPSELSDVQEFYLSQYEEDQAFKEGNFLYTAQYFRNTSNYMNYIAMIEDVGITQDYSAPDTMERYTSRPDIASVTDYGAGRQATAVKKTVSGADEDLVKGATTAYHLLRSAIGASDEMGYPMVSSIRQAIDANRDSLSRYGGGRQEAENMITEMIGELSGLPGAGAAPEGQEFNELVDMLLAAFGS